MAADIGTSVDVVAKVKATRGTHSLRVLCSDGETRDVAIPTARKKWEQLAAILHGLDWMRIELRDIKKQTIGTIEAGVDEMDELDDDDMEGQDRRVIVLAGQMTKLMLSAQDVALMRDEKKTALLVDSHVKLTRVLTELVSALASLYGASLKAQSLTGDPEDDGLVSMGFMKDLPAMMQAYAAIKQASGAVAAPTNGKDT